MQQDIGSRERILPNGQSCHGSCKLNPSPPPQPALARQWKHPKEPAMREYSTREMKLLRANPYTLRVTKHKLYFTIRFKEAFQTSYEAGNSPRKVLEDLGYDPKMFGQKQIDSIVQRIKKEAASPQGFTEGQNRERRVLKPAEENDMSVERMWHELKYLRQEVEFLKKLSSTST